MLIKIFLYLALIVIFILVVSPTIANRLIFPVPLSSYTWEMPSVINVGTAETPVAAYWLPAHNERKVILYSHGNGTDIGMSDWLYRLFAQSGCSVLAYEYPGYGVTPGKPSEEGVYAAAEAAYRWLIEKEKYRSQDIISMGYSLGGGPACYLAENYSLGGLILEATFTSAPRVKTGIRILPYDPFPNIVRIPNIKCPKLIIHGTDDKCIPLSHAKQLANATTRCNLIIVEGAGHEDIIAVYGQDNYIKLIRKFIQNTGLYF